MNGSLVAELTAASAPTDVDVVMAACKLGSQFLNNLAGALETYKATGHLPALEASELSKYNELVKHGKDTAKRRKKAGEKKFNKDGSEKQPRKPTAYNYWMQKKLKELKLEAGLGSDEKHVDRFKAAAEFWRAMPTEEKEAVNADFKAKSAAGMDPATEAPLPAVVETSSEEEEEEHPLPHHLPPSTALPGAAAAPSPSSSSSSSDESISEINALTDNAPHLAAVPEKPKLVEVKREKKKKRKQEAAPQLMVPSPQMVSPVQAASPAAGEKKKKKKKIQAPTMI